MYVCVYVCIQRERDLFKDFMMNISGAKQPAQIQSVERRNFGLRTE